MSPELTSYIMRLATIFKKLRCEAPTPTNISTKSDPAITVKVAEGINDYLDRHGYSSVRDIIGALEV